MRRFSQRNQLVTLSEINITPLLDLAFVLLIIFVITTPLMDQTIKLDLPKGGRESKGTTKDNTRTVEVSPTGMYVVNRQNYSLVQLEAFLVREMRANPEVAVQIRADKSQPWEKVADLMDLLDRIELRRINFNYSPRR